MKRFRFTFIAVCAMLMFLGIQDLSLSLTNMEPEEVTIRALVSEGPVREWLHIENGVLDIQEAISTSGSINLDALLVPLKVDGRDEVISVLIETRDPQIMALFKKINFEFDSVVKKERFVKEQWSALHPQKDITGMQITGLIASGNSDKLLTLATDLKMPLAENVIFVAEGKEPPRYRGWFFVLVALAGTVKIVNVNRKKSGEVVVSGDQAQ